MQAAGFDVAKDLVELGKTAHGGAEDREELEEDEAEVEHRFAAGRGAARHETASLGERAHGALERLCADVLDDDVDAASVRQPPQLEREIDLAIENRLVCAE